jgi:hypothetical protein
MTIINSPSLINHIHSKQLSTGALFAVSNLHCSKTDQMKTIKVFGWHCPECEATLSNIRIAMQITGVEATLEIIESAEELVHTNIFAIPVVKVDGQTKVCGRIPDIIELRDILLN